MISLAKLPVRTLQLVVLLCTVLCSSQSLNSPFIQPLTGDTITSGTTYNITWTVITGSSLLNIEIKNTYNPISTYFNGSDCPGDLTDFQCSLIATNVQNLGVYQWLVPVAAPSSGFYTLDIYGSDGGLSGSTHYTTGEFFISQSQSGSSASATGDFFDYGSVATSSTVSSTASHTHKASAATSTGTVTAGANGTAIPTNSSNDQTGQPSMGILIGLVVGIVLVVISLLALALFFIRRKKAVKPKSNPSVSGRVRGDAAAESMDDQMELDEMSYKETMAEKSGAGGRIRYLEPEEGYDLPSGRLQY